MLKYAYYYEAMGQLDQAVGELRRAQELDPLSLVITGDLASVRYYQGRYPESLEIWQKARELDPNWLPPIFQYGQVYERQRMYDKAIGECQSAIEKFGRQPSILAPLGFAYGASGKRREAEAIATELETSWRRHYFSPANIALVHTAVGNKEKAFFWLAKAVEARDAQLVWQRLDPQFESLRSDPRFQALLQRMEKRDAAH